MTAIVAIQIVAFLGQLAALVATFVVLRRARRHCRGAEELRAQARQRLDRADKIYTDAWHWYRRVTGMEPDADPPTIKDVVH